MVELLTKVAQKNYFKFFADQWIVLECVGSYMEFANIQWSNLECLNNEAGNFQRSKIWQPFIHRECIPTHMKVPTYVKNN